MHERLANLLGAAALNVTDLTLMRIRKASGVSDSASAALITLAEHPGLSVTGLGESVGLSQPAAARMVDGLEEEGLVARRRGTGRAVDVRLTGAGRRRAAKLLDARRDALGELVDGLDAEDWQALTRLLEKLLLVVHPSISRTRATTPTNQLGVLLCRLCDRRACRAQGEPCPVTEAQQRAAERGTSV